MFWAKKKKSKFLHVLCENFKFDKTFFVKISKFYKIILWKFLQILQISQKYFCKNFKFDNYFVTFSNFTNLLLWNSFKFDKITFVKISIFLGRKFKIWQNYFVKISNLTKLFCKNFKFHKTTFVKIISNFIKLFLWKFQIWQNYFVKISNLTKLLLWNFLQK